MGEDTKIHAANNLVSIPPLGGATSLPTPQASVPRCGKTETSLHRAQ